MSFRTIRLPNDPMILIVEDNRINQMLLTKKLEQQGLHSLLLAKNGHEAVTMALENDPDLILMDIQLPDMNGNEVIRSLRKQKFSGAIVAISADSAKEDMDKGFASGANGYISKPIDFTVFFSKINEILQKTTDHEKSREIKSKEKINPSISAAAKNIFIADAKEKLQIIAKALGRGDNENKMERIKAIAHEYKGNAGYFGLSELENVAKELDRGFKNDERPEYLERLIGQLVAVIEGIIHNENA